MRNLPFHGYAHNQLWLEIVALATDLLAWMQTLALPTAKTSHHQRPPHTQQPPSPAT